jgi:hypothetical protein
MKSSRSPGHFLAVVPVMPEIARDVIGRQRRSPRRHKRGCDDIFSHQRGFFSLSMIRKSAQRFSEKIMLEQQPEAR